MKKALRTTCIVIAVVVVGAFIFSSHLYERAEMEAGMRSTAHCVMLNVGILLNESFEKEHIYPNEGDYLNDIGDQINSLGCGASPRMLDGELLDTFDDPYCYERISDIHVIIYSKNIFFIDDGKKTDDYLAFSLENGEFKNHKITTGGQCRG